MPKLMLVLDHQIVHPSARLTVFLANTSFEVDIEPVGVDDHGPPCLCHSHVVVPPLVFLSRCLPLHLLPLLFPVVTRCSSSFVLMRWPEILLLFS